LIEPGGLIKTGIALCVNQKDAILDWMRELRDATAKIAIDRRLKRIEQGNFGDHRLCREGVWELRIDIGPGYRVYYAITGNQIVLLLCGGDKQTQRADITRACDYWRDWQKRRTDER
jgi:putative addiction module killer protein